MPELMRHDPGGKPERMTDLVASNREVDAGLLPCRACGPTTARRRAKDRGSERISGDGRDGRQTNRREPYVPFSVCRGDVYCPLIGAGGAEAIEGEIDALANAHTRVTNQQKSVGAQIVASKELLLQ